MTKSEDSHNKPEKEPVGDASQNESPTLSEKIKKELEVSDHRTKAILKAIPDMIFRMNDQYVFLDYHASHEDLYTNPENFIHHKVDKVLPEALANQIIKKIDQTLKSGKLQVFKYSLANPFDHKECVFEARMSPLNETEIVAIIRNITEHQILKQTIEEKEQALADQEKLYRQLLKRLPDGVYKSTHQGKFVEVNQAMVEMLGYDSKEELMAIDIKNELYIQPTDREELMHDAGKTKIQQYQLRKKDGTLIWVEDHGWYIAGQDGNIEFHEGIIRDITEKKKAQDAIRESEEKYRIFINATTDMAFLKDEKHRYIIVNQALIDFFEKDQSSVIGKTDFELMPEAGAKGCYQSDIDALNSSRPVISSEKIGDTIYETTKFKVPLGNGRIGIGGYIRDITERTIAQEKLKELNATKDKLFSLIAHDLKGPFNSILGFADLLMESFQEMDPESLKKSLSIIYASSKQAFGLLENLLIWSRSQTGNIPYEPTHVNLCQKAEENISLLQLQARTKEIAIGLEIPSDLSVFADRNMLDTILRNLLTNAIKFTPRGGQIVVSAHADTNFIDVIVSDNGTGIPKKNLEEIFRIDSKLTTPGTEKEKGSGLGLILCREFMEKHQGSISVKSTEGKGSTFICHFPVPAI